MSDCRSYEFRTIKTRGIQSASVNIEHDEHIILIRIEIENPFDFLGKRKIFFLTVNVKFQILFLGT